MLKSIKIEDIVTIAKAAGDAIMQIYCRDFSIEYKDNQNPLTEADKKAHEIIANGLNLLSVQLPILSEEGHKIPYDKRKNWEYFWMIDPLDGTKEFIKKNDEFTVNIALIHRNLPVLGVVYAPALGEMYWAKQGDGAYKDGFKLPLYSNNKPAETIRVIASKSHLSSETKRYIDELAKFADHIECVSKGSSLKLCMVAEGSADIYPRLAPTMEWDTAAANAIVREAGKMSYQYDQKRPLIYNKEDLLNPWFITQGLITDFTQIL